MKKLIVLSVALSSISLLSCKKCYTCNHTQTEDSGFGPITTEGPYGSDIYYCGKSKEIKAYEEENTYTNGNISVVMKCNKIK